MFIISHTNPYPIVKSAATASTAVAGRLFCAKTSTPVVSPWTVVSQTTLHSTSPASSIPTVPHNIPYHSKQEKCYKIHNLTDEEATLLEPAACAIHGLDKLRPKVGCEVLLLGACL
jgi:hypothetical protein